MIRDAQGFNLAGLPIEDVARSGLTQQVNDAGTVRRVTESKTADGSADVPFTSVDILLEGGVLNVGNKWTIALKNADRRCLRTGSTRQAQKKESEISTPKGFFYSVRP